MNCPRCGHSNPPELLFCEECDWRLDQPFRSPRKRNPLIISTAALLVGAVAIALVFAQDSSVYPLAVGAVGLVLGSYSLNVPRHLNSDNKTVCMAISAVGMVLSIIAFMLGIISYGAS